MSSSPSPSLLETRPKRGPPTRSPPVETPTRVSSQLGPFPERFRSHQSSGFFNQSAYSHYPPYKDEEDRSTTTGPESQYYPFSDIDIPFYATELPQDWTAFDRLAEEDDRERVETLKRTLDNLLIFAALFCAVSAAILAYTLPLISPGSPDRTNELLLAILERTIANGSNGTTGESTNPDGTPDNGIPPFAPRFSYYMANTYISMSLTLSLISAFVCVVGQQWLIYYQRHGVGGANKERWERQLKLNGAKRWQLRYIVENLLPTALQISVTFFLIGFITILFTIGPSIAWPNCEITIIGGALFSATTVAAVWDPHCPFQTPFSQPLLVFKKIIPWAARSIARTVSGEARKPDFSKAHALLQKARRRREKIPIIQAGAVCWILETTGKEDALHAAAWNITTITDSKALERIYRRDARQTLRHMWETAADSLVEQTLVASGEPRDADQRARLADAAAYSQADAHIILNVGKSRDWFPDMTRLGIVTDRGRQHALTWRAALTQVIDYSSPDFVHPKLRPRYIGVCSIALLYHRLYCDARNEDSPTHGGEEILRTFSFLSLTEWGNSVKSIALVAWSLAAIPRKWPDRAPSDLSVAIQEFEADFKDLQQIYSGGDSSDVVSHLATALETYAERQAPDVYGLAMPPDSAYAGLLHAISDTTGLRVGGNSQRLIMASGNVLQSIQDRIGVDRKTMMTDSDFDSLVKLRSELIEFLPMVFDSSTLESLRAWNDTTMESVVQAVTLYARTVGGLPEQYPKHHRVIFALSNFCDLLSRSNSSRLPDNIRRDFKTAVDGVLPPRVKRPERD